MASDWSGFYIFSYYDILNNFEYCDDDIRDRKFVIHSLDLESIGSSHGVE